MQVNLTWWLNEHGLRVIAKRVARLMRVMWPQATMPGPHRSRPHPQHPICRYLLRGMETQGPYEVWSTDITYIPMRRAFIYLVAVMDWFSRYVIAWDLSNTIDAGFCVVALSKLLTTGRSHLQRRPGQPVHERGVHRYAVPGRHSDKHGRGRALDNALIERLWRSVKYEDVCLREYLDGHFLYRGLSRYFRFYNHERPSSDLGDGTQQLPQQGAQPRKYSVALTSVLPSFR